LNTLNPKWEKDLLNATLAKQLAGLPLLTESSFAKLIAHQPAPKSSSCATSKFQ
jgi:hypothetical protein